MESIEIPEPSGYASGATAEEVPPSPGEAASYRLNLELDDFDPSFNPNSRFSLDDSFSDLFSPPDRSGYFVIPELGVAFDPNSGSWYGYMEVDGAPYFSAVPLEPEEFWLRISVDNDKSKFIWPVDDPIVTSAYGPRNPKIGSKFHLGLDICGGKEIKASCDGVVVSAGYDSVNGWYVVLDHGNGERTIYCHLKEKSLVNVGDQVAQGQQIGIMGSTGCSTGVHLHFGYSLNGKKLDPMLILLYHIVLK